ncbi:hypothetical protein [Tropicimonas marinistellae]|uniref:hypothetical protein n=1 Tax=Tropicimonas marinistellae TaxID=1739787 RepID=UPI00122DFD29|nr:hypothetical protein [Tropicimonas marinistellae]
MEMWLDTNATPKGHRPTGVSPIDISKSFIPETIRVGCPELPATPATAVPENVTGDSGTSSLAGVGYLLELQPANPATSPTTTNHSRIILPLQSTSFGFLRSTTPTKTEHTSIPG